jgi:hypothetical protein
MRRNTWIPWLGSGARAAAAQPGWACRARGRARARLGALRSFAKLLPALGAGLCACARTPLPDATGTHGAVAAAPLTPAPLTPPPALARATRAERAAPEPRAGSRGEPPSQHLFWIQVGESRLALSFDPSAFALPPAELMAWVERCARAVATYYGAFPVPELEIRLRVFDGQGMRGGRALATRPPRILMDVGDASTARHLSHNWSMTHEMVHLAFPSMASQHLWIEEGLASYVEPIARARIGWLSEDDVWKEWLGNMHQGLPGPGDRGLDHTPTWARTYWGGALFCLLADLEIRKRTQQRYQLRDALSAIVAAGGHLGVSWPLERALRVADEATQTTVLADLYREMKDQPVAVDLEALWTTLGVAWDSGGVRYTDAAPLALLRRDFVLGPGVAP